MYQMKYVRVLSSILKALSHLSGEASWAFCMHGISSTEKEFCGQTEFCKFCFYFPSRVRGTCVSVAGVLRGMHATPGDSTWKLPIRYRQHTCTTRYGRVNSVVKAKALRARCEDTWHIKINFFPDVGKQFISIGKSKWFPDIAETFMDLLISEIINWYWKFLSDTGNYFSESWNTGLIYFWRPCPFTDMVYLWS